MPVGITICYCALYNYKPIVSFMSALPMVSVTSGTHFMCPEDTILSC